jgi:hypothetical protein
MAFKQRSSGLPFKEIGSSPVKQTEKYEGQQGDKPTKRAVIEKSSEAHGTSGGYKSTEFVKGGRDEDKTTKSVTLKERKPATDGSTGDKSTYTQTKTKISRKGKTKTKTKEISGKKYRRKLARKTAKSIRRGSDKETYNMASE